MKTTNNGFPPTEEFSSLGENCYFSLFWPPISPSRPPPQSWVRPAHPDCGPARATPLDRGEKIGTFDLKQEQTISSHFTHPPWFGQTIENFVRYIMILFAIDQLSSHMWDFYFKNKTWTICIDFEDFLVVGSAQCRTNTKSTHRAPSPRGLAPPP